MLVTFEPSLVFAGQKDDLWIETLKEDTNCFGLTQNYWKKKITQVLLCCSKMEITE